MKRKIDLVQLKVKSFVTEVSKDKEQTLQGGSVIDRFTKVGCTIKRTACCAIGPIRTRQYCDT